MTQPKLTVAICMHNSCQNVCEIVEELYHQEEPWLEVIVLNDASTEDTKPVEELCNKHHFRYIEAEKNLGEAGARQRVLDEANGEYFAWVDADDFITANYIDTIYSEITLYKPDIIFHKWKFIDGHIANDHDKPLTNWNVWANVYRLEAVKDVKFDLDRQIASDYFWLVEAFPKCNNVIYSDKIVNIYNDKNPDSLTHRFERGEVTARFSEA